MRKISHVAAIYYILGDLPALDAVLSDIERVGPTSSSEATWLPVLCRRRPLIA